MRRLVILIVCSLLVVGTLPNAIAAPGDADEDRAVIVMLRDDVRNPKKVAAEIARREGLEVTNVFDTVVTGFAARVPAGRVGALRRDKRIVSVEPDRVVRAFAELLPTGVDRIGADTAGEGVLPTRAGDPVAVIDTGINRNHPDLNVVGGFNCTSNKKRRQWGDDNGHGSHVAGIIGAKNNGSGVVGVAPGTPLYGVKVLDSGGRGFDSWVICGLDWAAKKGIPIANLSLGGFAQPFDDPDDCVGDLHEAVCNAVAAGVTVVVAAGNSGLDAVGFVPAMYSQVTTVSALTDTDGCAGGQGPSAGGGGQDDSLATYSNFGEVVDVAAPGTDIRSTWKANIRTKRNGKVKRNFATYRTISGTSMAAPHVAAAYALGWDGSKEVGPIPGDNDGHDEGIVKLSDNTGCDAGITAGVDDDGEPRRRNEPRRR